MRPRTEGDGAVLGMYLVAIVVAVVQIVKSPDVNPVERAIWVVAVLLAPLAGALVWYALGPHPFGLGVDRDRS